MPTIQRPAKATKVWDGWDGWRKVAGEALELPEVLIQQRTAAKFLVVTDSSYWVFAWRSCQEQLGKQLVPVSCWEPLVRAIILHFLLMISKLNWAKESSANMAAIRQRYKENTSYFNIKSTLRKEPISINVTKETLIVWWMNEKITEQHYVVDTILTLQIKK